MIDFTDLQEGILIAYAQPVEQVALFAAVLLVILAVNLMALISIRRVTRF